MSAGLESCERLLTRAALICFVPIWVYVIYVDSIYQKMANIDRKFDLLASKITAFFLS